MHFELADPYNCHKRWQLGSIIFVSGGLRSRYPLNIQLRTSPTKNQLLVPHTGSRGEPNGTSQSQGAYWCLTGGPGDQVIQGNVLVPHGGTGGPDIGTSQRDLMLVPHRGSCYWYLTEGPDIGTSQSPAHDRVPHTGLAVSVRLSRSDPCFARDTAPRPAGILSTSALPWLELASLLGLLAKIKV